MNIKLLDALFTTSGAVMVMSDDFVWHTQKAGSTSKESCVKRIFFTMVLNVMLGNLTGVLHPAAAAAAPVAPAPVGSW